MTKEKLQTLRKNVKDRRPLIHCITNPISINQCANTILAVGARPIMAEHPLEVEDITKTASALMLNIANITDARMQSIRLSAMTAKQMKIPFVLDAVGIACSSLRREYTLGLLKDTVPDMIKGNYSEICALADEAYRSSGVDADRNTTGQMTINAALSAARLYNTVILASGGTDIITDGRDVILVHNGTPKLGTVTGTGCMLGALTAAYLSAAEGDCVTAALAACGVLGVCGELAERYNGNGSFFVGLMDELSLLTDKELEDRLRYEIIKRQRGESIEKL